VANRIIFNYLAIAALAAVAEVQGETMNPTFPAGSEIAVVLSKDRFFPSEIRLRSGIPTTLVFSTVNRKPAALVIEPVPETFVQPGATPKAEITRELGNDRVTAISFEPQKGSYRFHDALGGGRGILIVE
jgi:hypothetical protein